ncbi:unnamed protein product [Macrosiphum euphorbiae]|uniref:MADF domain-containing protein n=1 Tax=Macrosiphum euphorbiae TaxID=13131 RepID=A0AAV0XTT5_9HEMI|nr:unnamed protein product [Macrosiphum euphorbiae]
MEDEILIECVRKYAFIYDPTEKGHADMRLLKNAWEEVAKTVGSSVSECKKRWTSLRDQFRRNVVKKKTVSGQGAETRVKWRFEDTLSFLLPHMKERTQKSNLDIGNLTDSHDKDCSINITNDDETNQFLEGSVESPFPSNSSYEVPSPLPSTSSYAHPSPASTISASLGSNSHSKNNNKTSQQPTTAQVLQNYLDSKKAKLEHTASDHIGAFFIAMEATTRRLPPVLQIEAKAKISALLSDLEMKAFYLSNQQNVSIASPHQSTSSSSSFNNTENMTLTAHNIASPFQSTSFNNQTNNMTSPSKPVDFSNQQHRIIAHCTTETSTSGDQIEIFGIDSNLYSFQ